VSQKSREAQANAFKEKVDMNLVKNVLCHCKYCKKINPHKLRQHCKECFLETEGIIDKLPKCDMNLLKENPEESKRQQAEKELIIEKNIRIGELLTQCSTLFTAAYSIAGTKISDNEFIQCQNIALEDKCKRFGRPSGLSSRTFLYTTYWKNADPKPSYHALSKIVKVSTTQVVRDLKQLGWITDDVVETYIEE